MMQLAIKNMVCDRCVMVVERLLQSLQVPVTAVKLGTAELAVDQLSDAQRQQIRNELEVLGFELLDERKALIAEQIRLFIIESVHRDQSEQHLKFSERLAAALHMDYGQLSKIFSEQEGITIEQYIIAQRVERVKELLSYGEKNLNEISLELGYSSSSALINQFKKITGVTPGQFKAGFELPRRPLDKLR